MSGFGSVPPGGGWSVPPPPPPAEDAPVVAPRRSRKPLVALLIAIVVVAATVGGVLGFRLLGGSADSLASMAPSDTIVYVNAHLDPSAGQKLALNGLLDKFPSLGGSSRDATINGWIDSALQPTGLTHADVRPWLGSDISLVVPSSALGYESPSNATLAPADFAVLVSSTNDSEAQAAITALRQKSGPNAHWMTSTYGGVTLQNLAGLEGATFAVTNHALIVGDTANAVHEVIDTAQGKHTALASNASYNTAAGQVPNDHIGFAFVDLGAIVAKMPRGAGQLLPQQALDALQGYRGVAAALVAQSNGLSVNAVEDFDPSQLAPDQRSQIAQAGHVNGSLAFMPRTAYLAGMLTGLEQALQGVLSTAAVGFGIDIGSILQQFGITGPGGIVDHLSGDGGIELTPDSSPAIPGGAIVIGTDSDAAAQRFVDTLVQTLCSDECTPSISTQDDGGATISTLTFPSDSLSAYEPSWTVYKGWIIIGSSAQQVKAAVDADRNGATLATNPDYAAVMSQVGASNTGSMFIDVQPMLSVIRAALSPDDRSSFDRDVAPNLKPFKAFGLATHNASDHVSINVFTLIQ